MTRVVSVVVLVGVVALGVQRLALATMSRDVATEPSSRTEVVVRAAAVREPHYGLLEMTRALFLACRLQVTVDLVERAFERLSPATFRFVVQPALNESDRRQLHGCLEDARLEHLQLDVVAMRQLEPPQQQAPSASSSATW